MSQLERYSTAIGVFKNKYQNLPGDIPCTTATGFGFTCSSILESATRPPNQNGRIDIITAGGSQNYPGVEPALSFVQLSQAQLIDKTLTYQSAFLAGYPALQMNPAAAMMLRSDFNDGTPFFFLSMHHDSTGGNWVGAMTGSTLTPAQSYGLDAKMDNGLPCTGNVRVVELHNASTQCPNVAGDNSQCMNTNMSDRQYNITNSNIACQIGVKAF